MNNRFRINDLARIETQARALARSGKYRSHVAIRNVLEASGFELTAKIFDNRWSQTEIDRLCHQARRIGAAA